MDHKFDAVAKAVATGQTRRKALRWLSGMLGGMLVGSPLVGYAAPTTRPGGGGSQTCNRFCAMNTRSTSDRQNCLSACQACSGNISQICGQRGQFVCCSSLNQICTKPGGVCCDQAAVCGDACCPSGQNCCNSACTDFSMDVNNCGGCGQVCPVSNARCVGGNCVVGPSSFEVQGCFCNGKQVLVCRSCGNTDIPTQDAFCASFCEGGTLSQICNPNGPSYCP
jgi:hypothetical protein